jgi:hypothetical protein
MNIEQIIIALASAGAVAALFAVAWGLGFRTRVKIADEAAARALIAEAEPDAQVLGFALDKQGAAALARLADGRILVIRGLGDRFAVRAFPAAAISVAPEPGGMRVRFADLGFPALKFSADRIPDWLTPARF